MELRSMDGATENSMVIAGQPISGIGWWLRLILCWAGSTGLTVPVPWASFWPACAICISSVCCGETVGPPRGVRRAVVSACAVIGPEPPRSMPSGTAGFGSVEVGSELAQAIGLSSKRLMTKGRKRRAIILKLSLRASGQVVSAPLLPAKTNAERDWVFAARYTGLEANGPATRGEIRAGLAQRPTSRRIRIGPKRPAGEGRAECVVMDPRREFCRGVAGIGRNIDGRAA